jgi:hypothetical protein
VRLLFAGAVIISSLAIVLDSFKIKTHTLLIQRLEQTIEEIMETAGMTLFLLAFFHRFTSYLARLSGSNR